MDENIKRGIKRLAEDAEVGIARSILRWKCKKEGVAPPQDDELESRSRMVADKAHRVISKRGMNVWNEFKKVYTKSRAKEDPGE
jgi:hypothetical protein